MSDANLDRYETSCLSFSAAYLTAMLLCIFCGLFSGYDSAIALAVFLLANAMIRSHFTLLSISERGKIDGASRG